MRLLKLILDLSHVFATAVAVAVLYFFVLLDRVSAVATFLAARFVWWISPLKMRKTTLRTLPGPPTWDRVMLNSFQNRLVLGARLHFLSPCRCRTCRERARDQSKAKVRS